MPLICCPYCGGRAAHEYFSSKTGEIDRCNACSGLFSRDRTGELGLDSHRNMVKEAVTEEYLGLYSAKDSVEYSIAKDVLDVLRKNAIASGNFLEIGCGNAMIGIVAQNNYPEIAYKGIEISPALYQATDARIKPRIIHAQNLEKALLQVSDASQEVVILHHVLEHLPEPRVVLDIIRTKLKPSAFLYVEVPNEQWKSGIIWFRHFFKRAGDDWFPGHINFFTRSTLMQLLKNQGFRTVLMEKVPAADYPDMVKKMMGGEILFRRNLAARIALSFLMWTRLERLVGYGIVLRCICRVS